MLDVLAFVLLLVLVIVLVIVIANSTHCYASFPNFNLRLVPKFPFGNAFLKSSALTHRTSTASHSK